uniref:Uncharacterized protein n=1 Tax=Picea glauca TaxID=3330 RepID=A0A101M3D0_PICGL|nr:hypothetical protein ABT39_MTgene20 [Picea glauca]QHR86213.1 hypothetical protein Q903MT_gene212 [Picea sitchensis]
MGVVVGVMGANTSRRRLHHLPRPLIPVNSSRRISSQSVELNEHMAQNTEKSPISSRQFNGKKRGPHIT